MNSDAFFFMSCYNNGCCNFNHGLGFGDGIDLASGKALNACAAQGIVYGVNDRIIIDQIKAERAGKGASIHGNCACRACPSHANYLCACDASYGEGKVSCIHARYNLREGYCIVHCGSIRGAGRSTDN